MKILFITGSNGGLFNSLLILLQSFAERLPGQTLAVCDFGFLPPQAQFLRELGLLFERPPELATHGVFTCKASLIRYLRVAGQNLSDYDALVWLDADLTLMRVGGADFEAVIAAMRTAGSETAACIEPGRRSLRAMAETFPEPAKMAPFLRL